MLVKNTYTLNELFFDELLRTSHIMNTESFFELVALFAFRVTLGMHGKKISQMKVKVTLKLKTTRIYSENDSVCQSLKNDSSNTRAADTK